MEKGLQEESAFREERRHVAFSFLNLSTDSNNYNLFVIVPVAGKEIAVFKKPKYFNWGKTLIEIDIKGTSEDYAPCYPAKHYVINPSACTEKFIPETSWIELRVNRGGKSTFAYLDYKDCDIIPLEEADISEETLYNTAYVNLSERAINNKIKLLAPNILIPIKGYFPYYIDVVVESVIKSIRKVVVVLTKEASVCEQILVPTLVNQLEYKETIRANGHLTVLCSKADNLEEAERMTFETIFNGVEERGSNKTRRGRVRKRRTATRGLTNSEEENGPKKKEKEKKEVKKTPPRKGKLRRKFTPTRELEPLEPEE